MARTSSPAPRPSRQSHVATCIALAVALLALGCARPGGAGGTQRGARDVIAAAELERVEVTTAYEAVAMLRPAFLRARGATGSRGGGTYAVVYLDDVRLGGLSELRSIQLAQVREIRYVGPADATTRWGTNHAGGAILVTSRVR